MIANAALLARVYDTPQARPLPPSESPCDGGQGHSAEDIEHNPMVVMAVMLLMAAIYLTKKASGK